jgi:hypothetical protein
VSSIACERVIQTGPRPRTIRLRFRAGGPSAAIAATIALIPPRVVADIARNRLRGARKWPSNWTANTPRNTPVDRAYFGATWRAEGGRFLGGRRPAFRALAPSPSPFFCSTVSTPEFPAHALTTMR